MEKLVLERLTCFLSNRKDLEPTKTLNFGDNISKVLPINVRKRREEVHLKTSQLSKFFVILL